MPWANEIGPVREPLVAVFSVRIYDIFDLMHDEPLARGATLMQATVAVRKKLAAPAKYANFHAIALDYSSIAVGKLRNSSHPHLCHIAHSKGTI